MFAVLITGLLLCLYAGMFWIAEATAGHAWGFSDVLMQTDAIGRISILACGTYLGVICQLLTARLHASKSPRIRILQELRASIETREFWMAVLASPVVLLAAYRAIAGLQSQVLIGLLAFQNAFFFHSVLGRNTSVHR